MSGQDLKQVELYLNSATYAREHGELDRYRSSYKANISCKEAITNAIRENYQNNRLNADATSAQLGEKFSTDRIAYVLAVTIQHKGWDGRISPENKTWAETIPTFEDLDSWQQDRSVHLVIDQTHPGLIDLFVTQFRKSLELNHQTPDKRPSVLAKLKENSAVAQDVTAPPKPAKEATR